MKVSTWILKWLTKKLASIVYLSDLLAHFSLHEIEYEQIDSEILKQFDILSEEDLQALSDKLYKAFLKDRR